MFIDNKLKFYLHSEDTSSKVFESVGISYIIFREPNIIKELVHQFMLINIYNSLIPPCLKYYISKWGWTFETHKEQTIKLKKKVCTQSVKSFFFGNLSMIYFSNTIFKKFMTFIIAGQSPEEHVSTEQFV